MYKSLIYVSDVLYNLEYDILGISEAGLDIDDEVPTFPNFSCAYNDKFRLIVYYRTSLKFSEVKIFANCPVIQLNGYHTSITFVYGEWTKFSWGTKKSISEQERCQILMEAFEIIHSKSRPSSLIVGDMNVHFERVNEENHIREFVDFYEELGYINNVEGFTRFSIGEQSESRSMIDFCLTRKIEGRCSLINFPKSDHMLVKFVIPSIKFERRKGRKVRIFKKDKQILDSFRAEAPDEAFSYDELNQMTMTEIDKIITNHLVKIGNACSKEITIYPGLPWMNEHLRELKILAMRARGAQRKIKLREYSEKLKMEYRKYVYRQRLKKGHCFPKKEHIPIKGLIIDGQYTEKKDEICEEMKKHFQKRMLNFQQNSNENFDEIIENLKKRIWSVDKNKTKKGWELKIPSITMLTNLIEKKLPEQLTQDIFGISYTLLKFSINHIITALHLLIKKSLLHGEVLDTWLLGILICVPKPGKDHKLSGSFRPISLSSIIFKIITLIVSTQLMQILVNFGIFDDERIFGFVSGRSASNGCEAILRKMAEMRQSSRYVSLATSDLLGAFDSIVNDVALNLIQSLEPAEKVSKWFRGYFQPREIRVRIESEISSPYAMTRGLYQGCTLSCVIFVFIMSQLNNYIPEASIYQYCDDSVILFASNDVNDHIRDIQDTMSKYEKFVDCAGMVVERQKTQRFSRVRKGELVPTELSMVEILGTPTENLDFIKYLGVKFSRNYSFFRMATDIDAKLRKKSGWLRKHCVHLPNNVRREFFMAHVVGIVNYAIREISPFFTQRDINLINSGYNKCLRSLYFLRKRERVCVSDIRNKLKIPSIHQLFREALELRAFKNGHKYLNEDIEKNRPNTRSKVAGTTFRFHDYKQYTYEYFESKIFRENNLSRFSCEKELVKYQKNLRKWEFENNMHFREKHNGKFYPYANCRLKVS